LNFHVIVTKANTLWLDFVVARPPQLSRSSRCCFLLPVKTCRIRKMLHFDIESLMHGGGLIGTIIIALIVFAESGLLIGFFLPGDTLLFSAGFLASQGYMNLPFLLMAVCVAAVVGDNVGYQIGRRYGRRLFQKENSF